MSEDQNQFYLSQAQLNGKLRYACRKGMLEEAKEFLKQGADINGTDAFGQTPLHGAAQWGNVAIVEFLVEQGAKINVQTHEGITPLDLAKKYYHLKVADYLEEQMKRQQEKAAS